MGRKGRNDASFKTKVVLEALKEQETLASLGQKYGIAPKQITDWKAEFVEKAEAVFSEPDKDCKELKELRRVNDRLLKKVGQLTVEVDFFCGSLRDAVSKEVMEELSERRPVGVRFPENRTVGS